MARMHRWPKNRREWRRPIAHLLKIRAKRWGLVRRRLARHDRSEEHLDASSSHAAHPFEVCHNSMEIHARLTQPAPVLSATRRKLLNQARQVALFRYRQLRSATKPRRSEQVKAKPA